MQKDYWFIVIAAILYGAITAGGKFFINLGLSLYEISLYPMVIMSLFFLIVILLRPRFLFKKDMVSFFIIYGLIGALAILAQFGGIILGVPVAIVALLLYSQPIWTTIFGRMILNEKVTIRKVLAVVVALIGVVLLLRSWSTESVGSPIGIIIASLGGIFLSLWIVWGRKSAISNQHYITTSTGWAFFSVFWLLLLWPITRFFIQDPNIVRLSMNLPLNYWLYLILFSLLTSIIPSLFFFKGIEKIHAIIAGIILLLEPIIATILAYILFEQPIGLNIILGGSMILFSNYLVMREPPNYSKKKRL